MLRFTAMLLVHARTFRESGSEASRPAPAIQQSLEHLHLPPAYSAQAGKAGKYVYVCMSKAGKRPDEAWENQDRFIVKPNIGQKGAHLVSVLDGHGKYGHIVSRAVKEELPEYLETALAKFPHAKEKAASGDRAELTKAIKMAHAEVQRGSEVTGKGKVSVADASGATCMSVLLFDDDQCGDIGAISANVGDSSGLRSRTQARKRSVRHPFGGKKYILEPLNVKHTPDLPEEEHRIQQAGGSVRRFDGYHGARHAESSLAMSRTFGDNLLGKPYGITAEPEVKYFEKDPGAGEEVVMLMSDGVSDFLSDKAALKMVTDGLKGKNPEKELPRICRSIIEKAEEGWLKENYDYVDDITSCILHKPKDF